MKNKLLIVLAVLCVLFGFTAWKLGKQYYEEKKLKQEYEKTISLTVQQLELSVIELSDSLALKQGEIEDMKISQNNLKALYGDLLKASDTKKKNVDRVTSISTVTYGRDTVICYVDSFGGLKANYKDEYAMIDVSIDSMKNADISYQVKDSLTVINYKKKHSILFGLIKWHSYEGTKIITHNPNATPAAAVTYSIIE